MALTQGGGRCPALPWDILPRLRCATAAHAEKARRLWRGLCVKVVDGTTTSLPDTPKNQRVYPQSGAQKPGCGFPLLRLVGVFSLSTGALLDYAKGKRLGKKDRLFVWDKPLLRRAYLPRFIWKTIPEQVSVRVLRFSLHVPGFRVRSVMLVTTLLDPEKYPTEALAFLYAERWRVELWFRDIKTSMGMEVLRCKTPRMVHKELEMFFIAYNLIRCLMAEASLRYQVGMSGLSFKGTVDSVRQFATAIAQARSRRTQRHLLEKLLEVIARDLLPERFGRYEPRAVKRRPKPFPLLNRPRASFKEIPHRNRYWKSNPRKASG